MTSDDEELAALRAGYGRRWHIWRNDSGWHAVRDAWSDPVNAETADALRVLLGPAEQGPTDQGSL